MFLSEALSAFYGSEKIWKSISIKRENEFQTGNHIDLLQTFDSSKFGLVKTCFSYFFKTLIMWFRVRQTTARQHSRNFHISNSILQGWLHLPY